MTTSLKRAGTVLLSVLLLCTLALSAGAASKLRVGVKFWKTGSDKESMANSGIDTSREASLTRQSNGTYTLTLPIQQVSKMGVTGYLTGLTIGDVTYNGTVTGDVTKDTGVLTIKNLPASVLTGSDVNKTSTVVKQFVVDFSREDYKPLMEQEVNGLTYRYVNSDKARLSVVVQGIENGSSSLLDANGELPAYYHTDYLGTTDYLTSAVNSKVISWTSYNEWGEITHNAVLKCGQRELDLVKEYATHDYDAVLDLYYAKARFYDAYNRTFTAQDPILDPSQYDLREYVKEPMALVQYLYVRDNAVNWIDPSGEAWFDAQGNWHYDNWEFVPDSNYERPANPRNSTLMEGHSGYAVQQLQILLRDKGYLSNSECDGIFGPKTRDAVEKFQEVHGLTVDGIVGPKTWAAFFDASPVIQPSAEKNEPLEKVEISGPAIDNWAATIYNNVVDRINALPSRDNLTESEVQKMVYEEAERMRPQFNAIYAVNHTYNRNNPDFKKIVDLFESPLYNDPTAHPDPPLFDGDNFYDNFVQGALVGAVNTGYYLNAYCSSATSNAYSIDPYQIRYSQNKINSPQYYIDLFSKEGWTCDPIDIVVMRDGKLTSLDNRRLFAAKYTNTDVQANVHAFDSALSAAETSRFTVGKNVPKTWGEAALFRIQNQSGKYSTYNPNGAYIIGWDGK